MTGERTSEDPFERELGDRLHAVADCIDADGVSRAGIAAAAERRRRQHARTRVLVASAAAAIAVVGGLLIAAPSGRHASQQLQSGDPTTTAAGPCTSGSIDDPAGWFRISKHQATVLRAAGIITAAQAEEREEHAVLLTHRQLQVFGENDHDLGKQLFQLGYADWAGIEYLRARALLTPRQEQSLADGIEPVLVQSQADALLAHFPDLVAVDVGGDPLVAPDLDSDSGSFAGSASGYEIPDPSATTEAGTDEALTPDEAAAIQRYEDQLRAATTTTALSFAPGEAPTTTAPDPCAAQPSGTADPGPRVAGGPSATTTSTP